MSSQLLTTGKAALLCSVKPDTVLKWIKKGVLPATRTVGGHYRVEEQDLLQVLSQDDGSESPQGRDGALFPPHALLGVHEQQSWDRVPGLRRVQDARDLVFPDGGRGQGERACQTVLQRTVRRSALTTAGCTVCPRTCWSSARMKA